MNVHLLGLLGLVLLKVQLLEVLKRLCERQLLVSADCQCFVFSRGYLSHLSEQCTSSYASTSRQNMSNWVRQSGPTLYLHGVRRR
jgi:hypothetical protein